MGGDSKVLILVGGDSKVLPFYYRPPLSEMGGDTTMPGNLLLSPPTEISFIEKLGVVVSPPNFQKWGVIVQCTITPHSSTGGGPNSTRTACLLNSSKWGVIVKCSLEKIF